MTRPPRVSKAMRTLLLAMALVVAACGAAGTPSSTSQQPVVAVDEARSYRLELELPKTTYAAGEPIEGIARLRFAGPGSTDIAGSGSGLIVTSLVDADGRVLTGAATSDCAPYTVDPANPITTGLVKSGGFLPDDPSDDFIESFLKDPLFRLPAGTWGIEASAEFMGPQCTLPLTKLSVRVPIVVTP